MSVNVDNEFRSPRSKFKRAQHHIATLQDAIDHFHSETVLEPSIEPILPDDHKWYKFALRASGLDTNATHDPIQRVLAPHIPSFAHRMYINAPPLEDLNAVVADAVQNLRQALDHSACAAARALGGTDDSISFPMRSGSTEPRIAEPEARNIKKQTSRLDQRICDVMRTAEPGGGVLYELHRLGNADKHRLICECHAHATSRLNHIAAGAGWIAAGFGDMEWSPTLRCLTFALTNSHKETGYDFDFEVQIRLKADGAIGKMPIMEAMTFMAGRVNETVELIAAETRSIIDARS